MPISVPKDISKFLRRSIAALQQVMAMPPRDTDAWPESVRQRSVQNIPPGETVFAGTNHQLTLVTIAEARRRDPTIRLGMIVMDEHADLYGLRDTGNVPDKSNWLGITMLSGDVARATIIGTSNLAAHMIAAVMNNSAEPFDTIWAPQLVTRRDILEKLTVYSDSDRTPTWHDALPRILDMEIEKMKHDGITAILVSVDLDVLPIEYTGFEYSILDPALSYLNGNAAEYVSAWEEEYSAGMTPQDIAMALRHIRKRCLQTGISFGAGNADGRLLGDIQEYLPHQDLNGKTGEAIDMILNAFYDAKQAWLSKFHIDSIFRT